MNSWFKGVCSRAILAYIKRLRPSLKYEEWLLLVAHNIQALLIMERGGIPGVLHEIRPKGTGSRSDVSIRILHSDSELFQRGHRTG